MQRSKTMATAIALFLMLTIAATLITLPIANAHTPAWTIPTYAYVTASPSTVGVGDYTLIVMWLDKYPVTSGGMGGDRWRGFTLAITKPDGSKETIPYTGETSQVGSAWITYTPDQAGDYSIVFSWPGQTLTNGTGTPNTFGLPFVGDYFQPSTSDPYILHVQQEPIAEWVEPPLPDYWNRPLNTANRNWAQLASNWLGGSWQRYRGFQESGQAPNSPHILYAKEIINGGMAEERYGGVKYDTTDYENFFGTPIVMSGKIFYNAATDPKYGYYCVDLRTGETLWYKNGTDNGLNNPWVTAPLYGWTLAGETFPQLSFGQLYHYHSVNGEGIREQLWMTQALESLNIQPKDLPNLKPDVLERLSPSDLDRLKAGQAVQLAASIRWYMLDPNTGNWVLTLKNMPGGTSVTDQDGSILLYSYSSTTGNFLAWNVSQSIPPPGPIGSPQQNWDPPVGAVIDAVNDTTWTTMGPIIIGQYEVTANDIRPRSGYTMNVTGPKGLPPLTNILQDENYVPKLLVFSVFPGFISLPGGTNEQRFEIAVVQINEHVAPYSPQPDETNTQNNNLGFGVTLQWDKNFTYPQGGNMSWTLGPMSYEDKVFTLWCKETRQWYGYSLTDGSLLWGPTASQPEWDMYGGGGTYAYGKLFSGNYGGVLYAYDIKTGKLLWNYTLTQIGHESPYGNYQISFGGFADGKVYIYSSEHSPTQPLWRGSYLRCINVTDGKEIWKILNFVSGMAIADGCIVAGNHYDNRMYVYGKGPSATTVTGSPKVSVNGDSVLIEGTVTDQSPGAKDTPAIADADMEAWMEYLYEQQAMPTMANGVEVTLDALDPNGNFVHIGTVTSDMSGMFKKAFTPEVPGEYTVIATFAGSESYGSSWAETAIDVSEAPATPTPPPAAAPTPPLDLYILIATVVIVIAIAIVGIMLRKRP